MCTRHTTQCAKYIHVLIRLHGKKSVNHGTYKLVGIGARCTEVTSHGGSIMQTSLLGFLTTVRDVGLLVQQVFNDVVQLVARER